jgi:hypothetical protein
MLRHQLTIPTWMLVIMMRLIGSACWRTYWGQVLLLASLIGRSLKSCLQRNEEPSSTDEALKVEEWRLAMLEEVASIEENKT